MPEAYAEFREKLHKLIVSHNIFDAITYAGRQYGIYNFKIIESKTDLDSFGTQLYDEFAVDTIDSEIHLLIGRGLLTQYEKLSRTMPERIENRILMAALHEPGHHKPEFCAVMITNQLL